MSIISSIETILVSSNYGNGKVFGQPKSVKTISLIKIVTNKKIYGIGETYSGIYSPELIDKVVNFLKPFLIGKKIDNSLDITVLRSIPFISSSGLIKSVISGIEIAFFDLLGKLYNKPIYELLNPYIKKPSFVNTYCSGGSVVFTCDDIKRELEDLIKTGFNSYKMRVGLKDLKDDIERVYCARNAMPGKNNLMIDAIMGTHKTKWNINDAKSFAKEIKNLNIKWLEEPLNPLNFHEMAKLQKQINVHLAFGESFTSFEEFNNAIISKASKYLQPDVTHCGYIDMIRLFKSKKIDNHKFALHVWGSKISLLANLHLAIAFKKNIEIIEIPNVKFNFLNKEFDEITNFKRGKIILHDNISGLGINIDGKSLNKYKFIKSSGFKI